VALLYGRAGRLTAKNGGFRPGQGPPGAGQSGAGRPSGSKEDWSKEETDHLFELCERFELKWVVIVDRYQSGSNRWGVQGAHLNPLDHFLNPLGLFLRTFILFIWRILSAFLRA
jgi:hypothetical protein